MMFQSTKAALTAAFLLCLSAGLAACDEQATPAGSASAQAATSARPATTVASTTAKPVTTSQAATVKDDDIPTAADYEIEAANEIHLANADAEFATLEKEITADK